MPPRAARLTGERAIAVRKVQFPLAVPHGLQFAVRRNSSRTRRAETGRRAARTSAAGCPSRRSCAPAARRRSAPQRWAGCRSWTPVRRTTLPAGILPGQRMSVGSRMPPSNSVPLPSRSGAGRSGVISVAQPRTVVGREDDQRVVRPGRCFWMAARISPTDQSTSITTSPNSPRPLLPRNLSDTCSGTCTMLCGTYRKKRLVRVPVDEVHGVFGVPGGQRLLLFRRDLGIDHAIALDQRQRWKPGFLVGGIRRQLDVLRMQRPHVVRIRQAEVLVEPVLQRQELRVVAQVPLAEAGGGIAFLFAHFGQRHFVRVDARLPRAAPARRRSRLGGGSSRSSAPRAMPNRRPTRRRSP